MKAYHLFAEEEEVVSGYYVDDTGSSQERWIKAIEHLEKEKVLYFKYNSCSNMQEKSVEEFGEEILEFVDKNPVKI